MPKTIRTVLLSLLSGILGLATLAAVLGAGFAITMSHGFHVTTPVSVPPAPPGPAGKEHRIPVAVLLGANGSVATDVLGPYEVLASSPRFHVFTVSVRREPVALSGGLTAIPDYSVQDVQNGATPTPAIIVTPAMSDPSGPDEAPLRNLIERVHHDGNTVMSVCAGAQVLAATDVLNGRHATSFWSDIDGLRRSHPETEWESGVRWVEDGNVITTAGVSSGIAGSLHLVEQYAGIEAAAGIAATIGYPAWKPGPPEHMSVNEISPADYPYALAATLPAFQPTYAIGLTPGVDEIAVAASAELYGGASFLAHTIPVAQDGTIKTRHGFMLTATAINNAPRVGRLIVPGVTHTPLHIDGVPTFFPQAQQHTGQSAFDPVFQDVAQLAGTHVALTAAKYIEYPLTDVHSAAPFPPRISFLLAATIIAATAVASIPFIAAKTRKRIKRTR